MANKKREKKIEKQSVKPTQIVLTNPNLLKVRNNIRTINDYSAGLSFAITNQGVFNNFTATLETQRETLSSVLQIGEKFKIETAKLSSLIDDTILPITSTVAEIGLINANTSKLLGIGSINTKQLELAQDFSNLALDTMKLQQDLIHSSFAVVEDSGILKLANDVVPAIQVVSSGVSEMARSFPIFPLFPPDTETALPSLDTARDETELDEEEISEHQTRLDNLLSEIDPSLVDFRKGVWIAFNGKSKDYIGQASSSMRRLVDKLLRELVPPENVEKMKYFKNSPKAKDERGRPTRRAKILYLIKWDEGKAKHLLRLTDGFLVAYDNLSAWEHVPIDKDGFVHGALIAIEGHLISILTTNEE